MENKFYQQTYKVLSPDSSPERLLKPSAAMKYFQEISDCHCALVGNGYHSLRERDMAFISVRTSVTFHRTPRCGDPIRCKTWHREMRGPQWIRDCVILDDADNILVESTTGWVLMTLSDRKVCRPNKVPGIHMVLAPEWALQNDRLGRMKLPEQMAGTAERKVEYSDLDYFGHLNNCVYADIICNAMPGGMDGRELKKLDIAFHMEAVEGDVLTLHTAEENGLCYFSGYHSRGKCFDAVAEPVPVVRCTST